MKRVKQQAISKTRLKARIEASGMPGGLGGVTLGVMKTLDLADVNRLREELKDGEPIELRDGGRPVARVVPFREQTIEERIDELVAQGKARRGTGTLPDWFLTAPRPKCENGSVLEQLLSDRRSKDY